MSSLLLDIFLKIKSVLCKNRVANRECFSVSEVALEQREGFGVKLEPYYRCSLKKKTKSCMTK